MNKVKQILNTKEKKMKESLKVFVDRKIKFEKEKVKLSKEDKIIVSYESKEFFILPKEYNFQNKDSWYIPKLNYLKLYNSGYINAILVDPKEFEKVIIKNGISCSGLSCNYTLIISNSEQIIQHELQHVFDNLFNLNLKSWEKEYHAILAELIFTCDSAKIMSSLENQIYTILDRMNWELDDHKTHEWVKSKEEYTGAQWEIIYKLGKMAIDERNSVQEIKKASLEILNESYKEKMGMSYSEIIEQIKSV